MLALNRFFIKISTQCIPLLVVENNVSLEEVSYRKRIPLHNRSYIFHFFFLGLKIFERNPIHLLKITKNADILGKSLENNVF